MIDRAARNQLAMQLPHFVTVLIDHFTYDDLSRHKLKEKLALSAHYKAIALTCILFLKSDQQYQWPAKQKGNPLRWLFTLLTLSLVASHPNSQFENSGNFAILPFLTADDLEVAKLNPVYLANV